MVAGMSEDKLSDAKIEAWNIMRIRCWDLTATLSNDMDVRNRLHDGCEAVMTRYMLTKKANTGQIDHARSRELLSSLAKQAETMIADYERLHTEFQIKLIFARREAPDVFDRDSTFFSSLLTELHDFSVTAKWLGERTPSLPVGSPGENLRRHALDALIQITEACTGEQVKQRRWRNSEDDPHFVGTAGEFVRDFFLAVDPTVTERQLANTMRNLKERGRRKRTTEN